MDKAHRDQPREGVGELLVGEDKKPPCPPAFLSHVPTLGLPSSRIWTLPGITGVGENL